MAVMMMVMKKRGGGGGDKMNQVINENQRLHEIYIISYLLEVIVYQFMRLTWTRDNYTATNQYYNIC